MISIPTTKLDRDVALKVLPETFTSDPDRPDRDTQCFGASSRVMVELDHVGEADAEEVGIQDH